MAQMEQALTNVGTDKTSATRDQKIHRGGCYVSELPQVELRLERNARTRWSPVIGNLNTTALLLLVAGRGSATDNWRGGRPAGVYAGRRGRNLGWRQTQLPRRDGL